MPNIYEYMKWRGDIPLDSLPYNELDAMLLSMISYNFLDDIFTGDGSDGYLNFECAGDMYFSKYPKNISLGALIPNAPMKAFRKMYKLPRYKNTEIGDFVNYVNKKEICQFCAMTYKLDPERIAIVFRGTDDTVIGWKEDFYIPIWGTIPSQSMALGYLEQISKKTNAKIILIGHSKGGTEALYAASYAPLDIQNRIETVYSFDGPGASDSLYESEGYKRIKNKYNHFIPQSSFVGLLMKNPDPPVITKSVKLGGAAQHDALSWDVLGGSFTPCESLSPGVAEQMEKINSLIEHMTPDEIKKFVDTLFDAVENTGSETLTDFKRNNIHNIGKFLTSINTSEKSVKIGITKLINQFLAISLNIKGKRTD